MTKVVDAQGYRPNVGIIICNEKNQLLWAKRTGMDAWQFPQGGVKPDEPLEQAMYRELAEEVGLTSDDITILGQTEDWLKYVFGGNKTTKSGETYTGQKQVWFLLRLQSDEDSIKLDNTEHPEFDEWRWVDFWYPLDHIVDFKKEVYQHVLKHFEAILFNKQAKA
jgi:putative (di)nucleoside polyphosphate hydrolase